MNPSDSTSIPAHPEGRPWRIGGVSYFNALPLMAGLADTPHVQLTLDIPANLAVHLHSGTLDLALAPIHDLLAAPENAPLQLLPVGCIASPHATRSVVLFHDKPLDALRTLHADTDSHTSAHLVQVILKRLTGHCPQLVPLCARKGVPDDAEAALLIGDKTLQQPPTRFAHQLDLGSAWHQLTDLPCVFAGWLARADSPAGLLTNALRERLTHNLAHLESLIQMHAPQAGWEPADALHWLQDTLSYRLGTSELAAITRFHQWLQEDHLLHQPLRGLPEEVGV